MTETPPEINVQPIMAAIRQRARQITQREESAVRQARKALSADLLIRTSRFGARVGTIRANVSRVGELPPQPPGLRGRLGGFAVRLVRRGLFWLIPSLQSMHEQMAQALEDQVKINEELVKALEQAHLRAELANERVSPQPEGTKTGD